MLGPVTSSPIKMGAEKEKMRQSGEKKNIIRENNFTNTAKLN